MPLFIDKETILANVEQSAIFEKYGVPYQEGLFKSTLRADDTIPSCSFYTKNGKLMMRDFSGHFWGDCFDLVQKVFSVKYGESLQIIARDFGLEDGVEKTPVIPLIPEKQKTSIRVKRRKWDKDTLKFWKEYGITRSSLEYFKVYPADVIWLDSGDGEFKSVYIYKKDKPAYIYHFGGHNYQIYFPYNVQPYPRFLVSDGTLVHGFEQLPLYGEECVITKSRKDIICLYEFGIPAIAPMAESVILPKEIIDIVKHRFKNVRSLMDYDNAGIHNAWEMRDRYSIKPLFFTDGIWRRKMGYRGAKDFSDHRKIHGKTKTLNLVNHVRRISP